MQHFAASYDPLHIVALGDEGGGGTKSRQVGPWE